MTMITLEQRITEDTELLDDLRAELKILRKQAADYRTWLQKSKAADGEETARQVPDVKCMGTLVKNCLDLEKSIAKCQYDQAGLSPCGYALDLDAARDSIGRKLDRLRG